MELIQFILVSLILGISFVAASWIASKSRPADETARILCDTLIRQNEVLFSRQVRILDQALGDREMQHEINRVMADARIAELKAGQKIDSYVAGTAPTGVNLEDVETDLSIE